MRRQAESERKREAQGRGSYCVRLCFLMMKKAGDSGTGDIQRTDRLPEYEETGRLRDRGDAYAQI